MPRTVLAELLLARAELAAGANVEARRPRRFGARPRSTPLDLPHLLYQTLFVDGQIAEAAGSRAEALGLLSLRLREFSSGLRSHLHSEDLKIAFVRDKQEVYESLIWLKLDAGPDPRGGAEEAFAWVESAKSRALADLIAPRAPLSAPVAGRRSGELRRERCAS